MRQFFTAFALGCALFALPASAQLRMPEQARHPVSLREQADVMRQKTIKKTPATRADYGDPIFEVEGDVKDYVKTYSGCLVYADLEYIDGEEVDTQIVWGDDNTVYFPNFISMLPTGTYVKASADGDKITMKLPQCVYLEEYEYDDEIVRSTYLLSGLDAEYIDGDYIMYYPMEEEMEVTFTIGDDGTVTMDPLEGADTIGLVGNDGYESYWMGFAEFSMFFTPAGNTRVDPSTLENTPYSFITTGYDTPQTTEPEFGYKVNIAFDGDDVYFSGLCLDETRWWFKGHRDGDKVTVDNNQKMGTLAGVYNISLMFCKRDPEAYGGFSLLPAETQFVFNYDEANRIFTTATPEVVLIVNALPDQIYYLTMAENPTFVYQPDAAGTPRDPWNLVFNAKGYESVGYGLLDVNLPVVSTDGVLLDRENMYYQIYIDGELMELDADEYGLPETTTDIPYNFYKQAIVCSRLSTCHEMIFHIEGFDKIGVKLFNVFDGITYESNLVELEVESGGVTSGISETGDANVVSETFLDLSGRRIHNPGKGIFVKRTVLDNGTIVNSKCVIR